MSIKIISINKRARFDYTLFESFEAGMVLTGSEVKSLRKESCQLKDAYVSFKKDEAYLEKVHIPQYKQASPFDHYNPERARKLLLHRKELNKLYGLIRAKGLSLIPVKMYFKRGKVKLEIALAKGKKKSDKRESIKKRDVNRQMARHLKHSKK